MRFSTTAILFFLTAQFVFADENVVIYKDQTAQLKRYSFAVASETFGTFNGAPVGTTALNVGYNFNNTWQLFGSYYNGNHYLFNEGGDSISGSEKTIGVRYKFSQSFYVRSSVSEQNINLSSGAYRVAGTVDTFNLSIGNQWDMNKFLIAVDWIGFSSRPLASNITSEQGAPSPGNTAKESLTDNARIRGPTVYLGLQF